MRKAFSVAALLLAASGVIPAETFQKSKLVQGNQESRVEINLDRQTQVMTIVPGVAIPYGSIEKLSYEQASRHRVKEGAIVMIASLGAGGVVMLTKSKSHWLYVDYKDSSGSGKNLILKLDKSEYKSVLSALHEQTGKEVETLASNHGHR